jgi:hypothetical protein
MPAGYAIWEEQSESATTAGDQCPPRSRRSCHVGAAAFAASSGGKLARPLHGVVRRNERDAVGYPQLLLDLFRSKQYELLGNKSTRQQYSKWRSQVVSATEPSTTYQAGASNGVTLSKQKWQ